MKSHLFHEALVPVVASRNAEPVLRWYAELLTGRHNARLCAIAPSSGAHRSPADAIRHFAATSRIGLIVSEWLADTRMLQGLLHLAQELRIPAVFIRHEGGAAPRRLVVATAGGPNVLEQMWVAREIARAHGTPVSLINWRKEDSPRDDPARSTESTGNITLENLSPRLLGMHADFETCRGIDFATCAVEHLRPDDMLLMGAPSPLRLTADFGGSVPDIVGRSVTVPIVLLSSPPARSASLRRLLWGGLVRTGMQARNKVDVLDTLVENLIRHNQLPRSSKRDIVDRAVRREQIMSTAVDGETAFPHVALRGFFGVAASMGICPEGVEFGSEDGRPTRFICLLMSPDGLYEEYLAALAKLARRMIDPDVRAALLACDAPRQALDVLEPRETRHPHETRPPERAEAPA